MTGIIFSFDFLSPYSFLASQRLCEFPDLAGATMEPVVFGSVLAHHGARGPGEIPLRRQHGLEDLLLLAQQHSVPLEGPPKHPFNSIYALRCTLACPVPAREQLVRRFFAAAWSEGQDLENIDVLAACLKDVGVEGLDPEAAATDPEIRKALKKTTRDFIERGGFGVPTLSVRGQLFFGQDRLELAAAFARGDLQLDPERLAQLQGRPQPPRLT